MTMTTMRSHYCGHINDDLLGKTLTVCGWVNRRRDHGGIIFIDLRDYSGIVQLVVNPDNTEIFARAEQVRSEFVLCVEGTVRRRPAGTENPDMLTGNLEVVSSTLQVLNPADTPPFQLNDKDVGDDVRLCYRYVDLRQPMMHRHLACRSAAARQLRHFLERHDFLDIETPMLTRATPEGARDYLVPSRTQTGRFFALPQSPQLFKQLLMMSGFDRYYQFARCFRDEDLRADRQPEFTQLDMEMAFVDEQMVMSMAENMIRELFKKLMEVQLPDPFPRLSYDQAMDRYGTDRPDLRYGLELCDLSELMQKVEFKVFAAPASRADSRVAALLLHGGATLSRKEIDDYTAYVAKFGAPGLAYIKHLDDGLQSPILKFLPPPVIQQVIERSGSQPGDIIFFGAGKKTLVNESLSALRTRLAKDRALYDSSKTQWCPCWIVDFPLFEPGDHKRQWKALHHPFTAPRADLATLNDAPGTCRSQAYDLVLNGVELGGGSIRIHNEAMQKAVFRLLGMSDEQAYEQFGFFLQALRLGCPPHGGIAFGFDRLIMMMMGANSIREVIAFPKTQAAHCPLTAAPAAVDKRQLQELGLVAATTPAAL